MKFPFDESKLEKRSEIATLLKLKEGTCLVLPSCLPSFFLLFFTFSYFFKKYSPLDSHQSYPLRSSIISTSLLSKLLKTASFWKNRSMYWFCLFDGYFPIFNNSSREHRCCDFLFRIRMQATYDFSCRHLSTLSLIFFRDYRKKNRISPPRSNHHPRMNSRSSDPTTGESIDALDLSFFLSFSPPRPVQWIFLARGMRSFH